MEKRFFKMLTRWAWLFLLATVLSAGLTYWVSQRQPGSYEATSRLIVGPGIDSANPDLNALRTGGQLMQTYAELPTTGPFLQNIIDALGLDMDQGTLRGLIEVKSNQETQILTIVARHENPEEAVKIANAVADGLVQASPSRPDSPEAVLKTQMLRQADSLEQTVTELETRINELQVQFSQTTEINQQRLIMDQLAQERDRLGDAQNTLAVIYESLQASPTNQVKIIEPAEAASPVDSQLWLQVIIGAAVGLVLSLLTALAFEYLLPATVETAEELVQATHVPFLGAVIRYKPPQGVGQERLVVGTLPRSHAAENYRIIGTRLLFSNGVQPLRSVVLASPHADTHVGEVAANLAITLAQSGYRVALVDANLHQPTIGPLFGIEEQVGLTDLLSGRRQTPDFIPVPWLSGLHILPTGIVDLNSFALLASSTIDNFLAQVEKQFDITLITVPPLLSYADSLFLASHADGVVFIVHSGQSQQEMVTDAVENLRTVGARILGTVLTNSRRGGTSLRTTTIEANGKANGEYHPVSFQHNGTQERPKRPLPAHLESETLVETRPSA